MRRIDKSCLATMQSPVRHLMEVAVGNSLFQIAPERQREFAQILDNFDIVYTNERPWRCCADPSARKIFLSRGAVELLWCTARAHYLFYERFIQGKSFAVQSVEIDCASDPLVSESLVLLKWAINCQRDGNSADDWPPNLPIPLKTAPAGPDNAANEICLVSCAFLLHHELAHIRLNHRGNVDTETSLYQEKDADNLAAEWMLDGLDTESPIFGKRMLGIVQTTVLTTALGLYGIRSMGGRTHPFSYDRLAALLERFLGRDNHVAKDIAFSALMLHFSNSGHRLQRQAFADTTEALDAIYNQLAKEYNACQ